MTTSLERATQRCGGARPSPTTAPASRPTLQPEIFERFARGDSSRSRRGGSTGLGLAIVAAVVKAHDGTIDVRSEPGSTEFVVTLPGGSQPTHSPVKSDA